MNCLYSLLLSSMKPTNKCKACYFLILTKNKYIIMKALELLKTSKSVKERAESYANSVKRNIQKDVIDNLISKKEKLEDELFDLTNFTLETNFNAGLKTMTKEDCENRFKRIIEVEYELELLDAELKVKQKSFDKYFI
jgi:hypothetical protein